MKYIAILLILMVVAGCASSRPMLSSQDSMRVEIRDTTIFRDSIIYAELPAESVSAQLSDADTSFLESSVASSKAWVADGILYHTLENKSDPILPVNFRFPTKIHSEKGYAVKLETRTVAVEKQFTLWQSFSMVLGRIALICLIVFFTLRLIRRKFLL